MVYFKFFYYKDQKPNSGLFIYLPSLKNEAKLARKWEESEVPFYASEIFSATLEKKMNKTE